MSARIDAHVHLWDRATDPQDWIDPDTMSPIDRDFGSAELGEMLAATGMDRGIVVQASNSLEESARLARVDPAAAAGLVTWVDLSADVVSQLDRIREHAAVPVVGARHLVHIDPDPEWLLRDDVGAGLAVLGKEGLGFDLVIRDWQLPQAVRLAQRHDELRLVLDHLGGPPPPGDDLEAWAIGLRRLAQHPNVVAKVSGLTSGLAPGAWSAGDLAGVVDIAVEAFGADRLLYGSDWPLAELGGGAVAWRQALETLLAGLSPTEQERIFGANAAAAYLLF